MYSTCSRIAGRGRGRQDREGLLEAKWLLNDCWRCCCCCCWGSTGMIYVCTTRIISWYSWVGADRGSSSILFFLGCVNVEANGWSTVEAAANGRNGWVEVNGWQKPIGLIIIEHLKEAATTRSSVTTCSVSSDLENFYFYYDATSSDDASPSSLYSV